MRTIQKITGLALLAALCVNTKAEGSSDYDLQFDFNSDGVTDSTDWQQLQEFAGSYKMEDEENMYFARQEFPATAGLIIDQTYGNRTKTQTDVDVTSIPEFYLPSIGQSTVVKNQSPFGTCWAFGGISSVESNLLRKRNAGADEQAAYSLDLSGASDEIDLSELYLAYENLEPVRDGSQAGEGALSMSNDINAHFAIGGFASSTQSILTAWDGPVTEEQEPYFPVKADEDGADVYDLTNEEADLSADPAAHVQSVLYLDSPSITHVNLDEKTYSFDSYDESAVLRAKQALYRYGALMVSYGADMSLPGEAGSGTYFNYRTWAQYDSSESVEINHLVSIVGWNDHYEKENFANSTGVLPDSDGAWLVKNSWGNYDYFLENYGERFLEVFENSRGTDEESVIDLYYNYGIPDDQGHGSGYFWLSYCDHSVNSICALDADDASDGFDYSHIYQYDYIIPYSFSMLSLPASNKDTKVANVFTSQRDEHLSAVSVYAAQPDVNAEICVYKLNENAADPSDGELVLKQTVTLNEKGFHTVPLDTMISLPSGTSFSVIENIVSPQGYSWLNLETILKPELQTPDNINPITCTLVCNEGESYAYVNNGSTMEWVNPSVLNESDAGSVFQFGNAYIKAYTNDGLIDTPLPSATAQNTVAPSVTEFIVMIIATLVLGAAAYFIHQKRDK